MDKTGDRRWVLLGAAGLVAFVLVLSGVGLFLTFRYPTDPKTVVVHYLHALTEGRCESAALYVSGPEMEGMLDNCPAGSGGLDLVVLEVKLNGATAWVSYDWTPRTRFAPLLDGEYLYQSVGPNALELRRIGGDWKIVAGRPG